VTIDAVFLPATPASTFTVILCNPNAALFELLALHPFWVEFYLQHGCNVVCWNYRGYGESSGSVTPECMRRDIDMLVTHFHAQGVHGESIGGIAACHASRRVKYTVCDRTFSSLSMIARHLTGPQISRVFRVITQWQADNVKALMQASSGELIVLQDFGDRVIHHAASLKVGLARRSFPDPQPRFANALACLVCALRNTGNNAIPSPVKEGVVVPHVPEPLTPLHRSRLSQTLSRALQLDGGHGALLGESLGLELSGRAGALADWLACTRTWGGSQAIGRLRAFASGVEDFGDFPPNVQAHITCLQEEFLKDAVPVLAVPTHVELVVLNCGHNGLPPPLSLEPLARALVRAQTGGDVV
jgi:pimeloyl-ACP methyl ester carboxylesterase